MSNQPIHSSLTEYKRGPCVGCSHTAIVACSPRFGSYQMYKLHYFQTSRELTLPPQKNPIRKPFHFFGGGRFFEISKPRDFLCQKKRRLQGTKNIK